MAIQHFLGVGGVADFSSETSLCGIVDQPKSEEAPSRGTPVTGANCGCCLMRPGGVLALVAATMATVVPISAAARMATPATATAATGMCCSFYGPRRLATLLWMIG
jgi:hypothetical protein